MLYPLIPGVALEMVDRMQAQGAVIDEPLLNEAPQWRGDLEAALGFKNHPVKGRERGDRGVQAPRNER